MEGDGILEGDILKVTSSVKLPMVTHPAMSSSGDSCSYDTPRAPLSPVTGGDAEDTPLITRIVIL